MHWQQIGKNIGTTRQDANADTLLLSDVDKTVEEVMGDIPAGTSVRDIISAFEQKLTEQKIARNRQMAEENAPRPRPLPIPKDSFWDFDDAPDHSPRDYRITYRRETRSFASKMRKLADMVANVTPGTTIEESIDRARKAVADKKSQLPDLTKIFPAKAGRLHKQSIMPALMLAAAPALGTAIMTMDDNAKTVSADDTHDGSVIRIPLPPADKFYCDEEHPYIFRGEKQDHVMTRNQMCKRLLQALPETGKTVKYNASMTVEAMENGDYRFRLKEDTVDIIVPRKNYKAVIEAWIVSGGIAQDPVPLTFPFGKWRIESGLGTNIASPGDVCGMNQFKPGTWAQAIDKYGRAHGYGEFRDSIRRTGAKYGNLDYAKVAADYGFRQLFNQYCRDVTLSGVIGIRNSLGITVSLQEKIDNGEIVLPNGRTSPSAQDVYIAHLLGVGETIYYQDSNGKPTSEVKERTGATEFFHVLATQPDRSMKSFVKPAHYQANDYFMEETVRVTNADGSESKKTEPMSAARFYERFGERWGFDQREFPDMKNWRVAAFHAAGSAKITPDEKGWFASERVDARHPRSNMPELTAYNSAVKISFK